MEARPRHPSRRAVRTLGVLSALFPLFLGSPSRAQTGLPLAEPRRVIDERAVAEISRAAVETAGTASGSDAETIRVPLDEVRIVPAPRPSRIQIFADGNLRKPVSEAIQQAGTGDEGPDAGARLGLVCTHPGRGTTWSGLVTVASTVKTVTRDYAGTVLMPGAGGGLSSGLLEFRKRLDPGTAGGLRRFLRHVLFADMHYYACVAASEWELGGQPARAVTSGLGALRVFSLIQATVGESEVGLGVELGGCFRHVGGDVGVPDLADERVAALGTRERTLWGLEAGMQVRVKDITAGLQLYALTAKGTDAPGLTRTQLIASVNLRGALFSGPGQD